MCGESCYGNVLEQVSRGEPGRRGAALHPRPRNSQALLWTSASEATPHLSVTQHHRVI